MMWRSLRQIIDRSLQIVVASDINTLVVWLLVAGGLMALLLYTVWRFYTQ